MNADGHGIFYLQRMYEKQRMGIIILPPNHFAESLEA
jgi:hypothetical protein